MKELKVNKSRKKIKCNFMSKTTKQLIFAGIVFSIILFMFLKGRYDAKELEKNKIYGYAKVEYFITGHKGKPGIRAMYYVNGQKYYTSIYIFRNDVVIVGDSVKIIYSSKDHSSSKILKDKDGFVITKPKPQPEIFLEDFEEINFDQINDSLYIRNKKHR